MNIAIIFAGGVGQRLNNDKAIPKQFLNIKDKPILIYTLEIFQKHPKIDKIYLSILPEYKEYAVELCKKYSIDKIASIVDGGFCAMDSIYNALNEAHKNNSDDSIVLIHDGVRPVLNSDVIDKNIESVKKFNSAITAIPCNETIIVSDDFKEVKKVPIRKETFKAQAPQSFYLKDIVEAHNEIRKINPKYENIVDNCTLYNALNKKLHLVEGNFGNIKITTPEDVYVLKGILEFIESQKG